MCVRAGGVGCVMESNYITHRRKKYIELPRDETAKYGDIIKRDFELCLICEESIDSLMEGINVGKLIDGWHVQAVYRKSDDIYSQHSTSNGSKE